MNDGDRFIESLSHGILEVGYGDGCVVIMNDHEVYKIGIVLTDDAAAKLASALTKHVPE